MERIKNLLPGSSPQNIPGQKTSGQGIRPASFIPPQIHDDPQDWEDYYKKLEDTGYAALPNCPKCSGKGYLFPIVKGKIDFEHRKTCNYAGCLRESIERYKTGDSYLKTIGIMSNDQTLATFRQEFGTKDTYAAFYWLALPDQDHPRRPFLLCYGSTGNGKTHLCNALALELNIQHIGVRMYAVADLMSELKMAMNNNTVEMKLSFIKSIPALILDDYGVNQCTEWEKAKLEEIIGARYRDKKITVLTTNRDVTELPERVLSRFNDKLLSIAVLNEGIDQRPLKKQ